MTRRAARERGLPAGRAQLILLAAGKGTRMKGMTENTPKTLIPILEKRCILEINIENVARSKAATTVLVVGGHAWPSLRAYLDSYAASEIPVRGMLNPDYDVAGPSRSIQVALAESKDFDRIIIANCDTIFSVEAFECMKMQRPGLYLLGSRVSAVQADDLIIDSDADGLIGSASKVGLDGGRAIISSGMLAAVGAEAMNILSDGLTAVLRREKEIGRFLPWHQLLSYFSERGVPAQLLLIDRSAWYEFDSMSCIARFQTQDNGAFLAPLHVAAPPPRCAHDRGHRRST
jgi:choline kinase